MSRCEDYLDDFDDAYDDCAYSLELAYPHVEWLLARFTAHSTFNLEWRTAVALSIANVENAVNYLLYCNRFLWKPYRLPYFLRNCIEAKPYILTPERICEVWAKDDFAGRGITIAFIDRMRQMLWDEPFYIAWAARPKL